ncbi:MAG: hypothetical protein U1F49_16140 [Rubrivivax sp.]
MQMAAGAGAEARAAQRHRCAGGEAARRCRGAQRRSLSKLADFAAGGATPARSLCARPAPRARWPRADPWPEALETLRYAGALRASGAFEYVEVNRRSTPSRSPATSRPTTAATSYQPALRADQPARGDGAHHRARPARHAGAPAGGGDRLGRRAEPPRPRAAVAWQRPQLRRSVNADGDGDAANGDDPSTAAQQPRFHGTHVAGTGRGHV